VHIVQAEGRKSAPLILIAAAAVTLILDQVSKAFIRVYLPRGDTVSLGFLKLRHVRNPGTAFGLISAKSWPFFATSIIIFFLLLIVLWRWGGPGSWVFQLGMGLIVGGALGNIIDRIIQGSVVDFIDIGFWPVFNLADMAIVVGVIITLFIVAKETWKTEAEKA
jgi:signal peptidase II